MPEWITQLLTLYGPLVGGWVAAYVLWQRVLLLQDRVQMAHTLALELAAENTKTMLALKAEFEQFRTTIRETTPRRRPAS